MIFSTLKTILAASACTASLCTAALADNFNIPAGDLESALDAYAAQTGVHLLYTEHSVQGVRTKGAAGPLSAGDALSRILSGTGFTMRRDSSGALAIVRGGSSALNDVADIQLQIAQAAPARAAVETVTVTSSKLGGADVQSIPIAITALSQEQLTATQTAGGPDLVKQVPNLTFTKTNFTGYSIQIRGIGTQAISVTTDPAVAVAFNDMPFIRNHFFEQEFYDVSQVEVLRGPQGTLYGRNATAGVVNLTSARPSDQFEAMASGEFGNYHQRRFEGMINLPLVDDRLDIRLAGEWTKRQGYSFNALTDQRIDGRDLWSGRLSIGFKPLENLQMNLVWEHFSENDDRIRSSKQLCKKDPGPETVDGFPSNLQGKVFLSQGCSPTSLYGDEAFQVVNGFSLPYYGGLVGAGFGLSVLNLLSASGNIDPYASVSQSRNLRVIESTLDPGYKVKNDILQLTTDYQVTPALTFTSQTGFSHDFLWSTQDYNRFNTQPGIFAYDPDTFGTLSVADGNYACADGTISYGGNSCVADGHGNGHPTAYFCDPQLGCSNRLVAQDLSKEHAWQLNQEFRLASNFSGPLNFSVGGNYMHYETAENYYVFFNTLTQYIAPRDWVPNVSDGSGCLTGGFVLSDPQNPGGPPGICAYIDPNPIDQVNDNGHNYFLSQNPYVLNSYAAFGEAYYNLADDLKLTGGLRWTQDRKHFTLIPSEVLVQGWGYPVTGVVNQQWSEFTGRFAANWTPKLDFTDQTMLYASFAHGYKAGGANPPGAVLLVYGGSQGQVPNPVHPLTFKPEFINAFELGTKNTLLDGALTLNGNVFYYDYKNYQISQIVDRTSVNLNFDAHVKGAELEATYEPVPGLRFNFGGGYENARLAKGTKAVDLMDRTAGHDGWMVVKPFVTQASNCILPTYVIAFQLNPGPGANYNAIPSDCGVAYVNQADPVTGEPYTSDLTGAISRHGDPIPPGSYPGFDPSTAPNNGVGFDKDISDNWLPNAPPFTITAGAQYSIPLSADWAGTLRADYYWQDYSWARVFNDNPYDRLRGYTNVNLTLILTSQAGWQVMLYDKNIFNTTAITGTFLNSDDTGLTTNVFLTDPKLIGIRVTKNW
jgi:outer membrane receptor protein involved in Fe transport